MEQITLAITRSYSHKLVPENHGIEGHRFAPLDFFASYGTEIPADSTLEFIKTESDRLYKLAKDDVERAIKETLEQLKNPANSLSGDQLKVLSEIVQAWSDDVDKEIFTEMVNKIKDKLDDKQLGFLRNLYSVKYE